ncbi:MAG: tRNA (guanosine(37)-N1)-methyltransferase TrmD, partial [Proteobacteria bacterium]|nr:tRNA (guanosine(37)-N1)-methyltransferase TrmD [Pseudomonadota bacterium]
LAAMVVIDAVTRIIPGTLGGVDSAGKDSFSDDLLEHAQYTRPKTFEGEDVPEVLLSGNHKEIEKWKLETSLIRTFLKRKDLLKNRPLSKQEIEILKKWCLDIEKIIHSQTLHSTDALSGSQ